MSQPQIDFGFTEYEESSPDDFGFVAEETTSPLMRGGRTLGRLGLAALEGVTKSASQLGGQPDLLAIRQAQLGEPARTPFFEAETGLEKGVSRAAEAALSTAALGGGGKIAGLAAGGGFLGQAVEEAGGGPTSQFVAEILPLAFSPVAAGKLVPSKAQKPLVDAAKRLGMTNKELAPLIRGPGAHGLSQSFLAKPATRKKIVEQSEKGVNRALSNADEAVRKIGEISQDLRTGLLDSFNELASKVEAGVGELAGNKKAASFLRQEMRQIAPRELTGNDLRKLYRAINENAVLRQSEVGRIAKETIVDTIAKANPQAAKEFQTANQLYTRLKVIEGGPRHAGERLDRMELYGLVTGIATGHTGQSIKTYLGTEGIRSSFTKAVSGPRGHRLVQKMFSALAEGKPAVAQAAAKRLLEETEQYDGKEESPRFSKRQIAGLGLVKKA